MIKSTQVLLTSATPDLIYAVDDAFRNVVARQMDWRAIAGADLGEETLLFIDWRLPDLSGLQFCRLLRSSGRPDQPHITMVLDEANEADQVRALKAGADDYIVGPLTSEVLVERIELYVPIEASTRKVSRISFGELAIDSGTFLAWYRGKHLSLGATEMHLLLHFSSHPNRVFTRRDLIGVLGKTMKVHDERTVDVWVSRLRRRLVSNGVPGEILRTVRAYGYLLDPAACA